ncbi:hypothetical protein O6H91_Y534200 [Diphasiastrum complanatum]|nr:hypothetical protein O6H91_Y534200 [Diphasiastrum complanatum]
MRPNSRTLPCQRHGDRLALSSSFFLLPSLFCFLCIAIAIAIEIGRSAYFPCKSKLDPSYSSVFCFALLFVYLLEAYKPSKSIALSDQSAVFCSALLSSDSACLIACLPLMQFLSVSQIERFLCLRVSDPSGKAILCVFRTLNQRCQTLS